MHFAWEWAYGWRFTGTDISPPSLRWAQQIVDMNPSLAGALRLRRQRQPAVIFDGIIGAAEQFDATLCNPPFHASAQEALDSTRRKQVNLARATRHRRERTPGAKGHDETQYSPPVGASGRRGGAQFWRPAQ